MFKNFIKNFNKLPISNKSMVYLLWIYATWWFITSIFINIYVFSLQSSVSQVIIYNIINYSWIITWFVGIWFLMSHLGKNIKKMYYIWYVLFILSFLSLFFLEWKLVWVYVFAIIFWIWDWIFWNAVHTQELKNIENKSRDFYSSTISAWDNVIKIFLPLIISWIFFIWKIFDFDGYTIIFLCLPFIYMISFFFINNIWDYFPAKIKFEDVKDFFDFKKYKYWHLYFLSSWINEALIIFLIPVLSIYFLKTEVNVWLFQAFLTFISTTLIVHLSSKRHEKNRFKYYFNISLLMMLNFVFLWAFLWTFTFVVFSLILLFLEPILWVSYHVYNLSLMDNIKTKNNDFYPSMLWREVFLYTWRIWVLLWLAFLVYFFKFDLEETLKTWIFLCIFSYIMLVWSIYFWEKREK
jgi:hypothetical protein